MTDDEYDYSGLRPCLEEGQIIHPDHRLADGVRAWCGNCGSYVKVTADGRYAPHRFRQTNYNNRRLPLEEA